MLDLNSRFILSQDIVLRSIGDKYWALNTQNGNQCRLNEVSYSLLNLTRECITLEDMVQQALQEYNIDRARLLADCDTMLQDALKKNIVKEVE